MHKNTNSSGDNNGGSKSINTTAVAAGVVTVVSILVLLGAGIMLVGIYMRARPKCWQSQRNKRKICVHNIKFNIS